MKLQVTDKLILATFIFLCVTGFAFYWRVFGENAPGDTNVKTGNYRLEDGMIEEAEKEFLEALIENPDHMAAHLSLGLTYMESKRYDQALESFDRAIEIEPNFAVAYADRGILYDLLGRYELALADYKKSIELDSEAVEGPGFLWRFMRNIHQKPPDVKARAEYLAEQLAKPENERLLKIPELDEKQQMHKNN